MLNYSLLLPYEKYPLIMITKLLLIFSIYLKTKGSCFMLLHVKEKDYNDKKEFYLFQEVVHLLFKLPLIAKSIILEKKFNTANI